MALMPYTGPSEHTVHNASNCICLCTVVTRVAPRFDCSIPETNCVTVTCCLRYYPFRPIFWPFFMHHLIIPYANQSRHHTVSTRWTIANDMFEMFVFETWTNLLIICCFAFLIKLLLFKYSKSIIFLFTII